MQIELISDRGVSLILEVEYEHTRLDGVVFKILSTTTEDQENFTSKEWRGFKPWAKQAYNMNIMEKNRCKYDMLLTAWEETQIIDAIDGDIRQHLMY